MCNRRAVPVVCMVACSGMMTAERYIEQYIVMLLFLLMDMLCGMVLLFVSRCVNHLGCISRLHNGFWFCAEAIM